MLRAHRLAIAAALFATTMTGAVACDETFENPPDYDLAKEPRDLSALAQSHDDLSATPADLAGKKDLLTLPVDLRLNLLDAL